MPGRNNVSSSQSATTTYPPYAHALAGAGAGLAAVALLHPLDTVRTHMQSSHILQPASLKTRPQPILRTMRYVINKEGTTALYRGLVPASIGSIISWACYFHVFQRARTGISPYISNDTVVHLLSGTVSGVITSVATNPIWVIKVRLQLQKTTPSTSGIWQQATTCSTIASPSNLKKKFVNGGGRPYTGFLDGLATIAREEGIRGLYRGLSPSLWLVSHGALQFTLYESIKSRLKQSRSSSSTNNNEINKTQQLSPTKSRDSLRNENKAASVSDALIASTVSKLVASVSTYPLQVARTRMQERMADGNRYGSFHRALWYIARTEGFAGLYRGLIANIMRVTPQAAVTFVTYEQVLRLCANT